MKYYLLETAPWETFYSAAAETTETIVNEFVSAYADYTKAEKFDKTKHQPAKHMSGVKNDVEPIRQALDKLKNRHNQQVVLFHKLENLRDRLIDQGDDAIAEVLNLWPDADRQQLRDLFYNKSLCRTGAFAVYALSEGIQNFTQSWNGTG